jgi:16S rRNA (adenine1518-N6/adenine1519-N6)-dimethyltransferase
LPDSFAAVSPRYRKRFGQHHLVDGGLCRPLVEFLAPAGERVMEIGPGAGALTAELLAAGAARVLALELDPAWAWDLRRRLADGTGEEAASKGRLAVAVADALDLPWDRLPAPTLAAGNLPYNIATALVERILPHHATVPRAAFLVQREVAERLVAGPGDGSYGSLSVVVAAYAEARILGRVRPGSFRPRPRVEGAFVGLRLQPPPLPPAAMRPFLATVRLAFGQRRKTLRNALAAGWGRSGAEAALDAAGILPTLRAEALGLTELLALHQARLGTGAG